MMHEAFEFWLAQARNLLRLYAKDITLDLAERILQFGRWLLGLSEHSLQQQGWSLLPVTSHQISHFLICTRTLAYIIRRAWLANNQVLVPNLLLRPNGQFRTSNGITTDTGPQNMNIRQEMWEDVFNIDHVQRNCWTIGDDAVHQLLDTNPITVDYSIRTDGAFTHVHFKQPMLADTEPQPSTRREIRGMADNDDLGKWAKGVYLLDKGPRGLGGERVNNSWIVGIDPGVSAMVMGTSTQEEEPQPGLWMNQFSILTRNYQQF
ncbi:hypothetical protein BJV82DRAFT_638326 [Fennellomyces sp. T-0311]|nr:hypothetical protein BJV82DRAFT_638326 [Fennellomyces sp. T-0311]